ncbi:hypothetical protein KJN74_02910 [Candidatus Bathyarchaeota archaeon]|nr:hypothetical protein [Candidatus Bathyarchaeota archaeon]
MGIFRNFREVFKELKHKKRGESITKLCPKCASQKISINCGSDTYPNLYGIVPRKYVCSDCGYRGPLILERINEDEETD